MVGKNMIKLIKQMLRFSGVGLICFFLDYFLMIIFTDVFHIGYLISCGTSFTIATVLNYILSMRFVFRSRENINKVFEFVAFVVLSLIGLGLTELLMWVSTDILGVDYKISKFVVAAIVTVYNFITRKVFLEEKKKSA